MTASLVPMAPGVYAWLYDGAEHGRTNSGVVIAEDGLSVIDAGAVPTSTNALVHELARLSPLPVRRLVLTGSHIDLVGGSASFPLPAVYGSSQTSAHLDQPPNPDAWSRLHPEHASEFAELHTRRVTHIIDEPAHLCPASIAVPAAGLQFENLAVQVPSANVVFAGGLASFTTVPLGFEADFPAWIETLDAMASWGELFVPAHGPIGGTEELRDLRNYFEACMNAAGSPANMPDGPWTSWRNQRFTAVNIERAAMLAHGDPSPPPSMLALLGMR